MYRGKLFDSTFVAVQARRIRMCDCTHTDMHNAVLLLEKHIYK
jgi:hypothetical protein